LWTACCVWGYLPTVRRQDEGALPPCWLSGEHGAMSEGKYRALIGHYQFRDKALIGYFSLSGCLFMGRFYVLICRGSTHELQPTRATTKPCQCVWFLASCGIPTRRSGLSTWQKVVCVPPPVSHHCAATGPASAACECSDATSPWSVRRRCAGCCRCTRTLSSGLRRQARHIFACAFCCSTPGPA